MPEYLDTTVSPHHWDTARVSRRHPAFDNSAINEDKEERAVKRSAGCELSARVHESSHLKGYSGVSSQRCLRYALKQWT